MKKMDTRAKCFVLVVLAAITFPAFGQIDHSTSDIVILDVPPLSVDLGQLESNETFPIFTEQYHLRLGIEPLPLDITESGITINGGSLSGGSVPGFSYINSHYVHFDTRFDERVRLHGSVTFDEDILGLIVLESTLEDTDPRLRRNDVQYPPITLLEDRGRGLEFDGTSGDWVFISEDRRTLLISLVNKNKIDQLRVITSASPDGGGESGEPCSALESAVFDIIPGNDQNEISEDKIGHISTTLFSREYFDASECVFTESLTFGRTGDELSLVHCGYIDENDDGLLDLQCNFDAQEARFEIGDTEGILKGLTVNGVEFEFVDNVEIKPGRKNRIICCSPPVKLTQLGDALVFASGQPRAQAFQISVYNIAGNSVFISPYTRGDRLIWRLKNHQNHEVANGVYLYRVAYLSHDGEVSYGPVKKIVILR